MQNPVRRGPEAAPDNLPLGAYGGPDTMAALSDILVHNPDCTVREIGEGLVILVPEVTTTHSLEDLGVYIWNRIDGQRDLDSVLSDLLDEYDVDEETARTDLLAFIDELVEARLLLPA